MSLITGFVLENANNKELIKKMTSKVEQYGKDTDYEVAKDRAFSIVSNSNEKIIHKGKYTILLDGKLSNEEDIFELVKKYEYEVAKYLRGYFLLVVYNEEDNSIYIARDPWGSKSMYYYCDNGSIAFSSEIKPLLTYPLYTKNFNNEILASFLAFNSIPTEETFFKGIFKINPGSYILFKSDQLIKEEYFKLDFSKTPLVHEELVNNIEKAVKNSVAINSRVSDNLGSFLSSGVDSSYLVSILKPKHTFTIGYRDFNLNEVEYASSLAKKLGIENHAVIVEKEDYIDNLPVVLRQMSEPLANPSLVPIYLLTKESSKYVDAVFSGEGADELFGGYNSYQEEVTQSWYMKIPYFIRHTASVCASILPDVRGLNFVYRRGKKLSDYNIGLGRVFRDEEALKIVKDKNQIKPINIVKPYYKKYSGLSTLEQRQMIDYYFWLVNDFAYGVDKCSLYNNMNGVTPYLDYGVYYSAMDLPTNEKISKTSTKIAFREAASRCIPDESFQRKKLGFPVPLKKWINDEDYYNRIKEKFNSDIAKKFFDQKKILKLLENNKSNKATEYKKVWAIYTFIIWYEEYYEGE